MEDYSFRPKSLVSVLPKDFCGDVSDQLLINDIQLDSRRISPGALFVALKGSQDNGELYISSAVENGAAAVLVEGCHVPSMLNLEIPIVGVDELKSKLADICINFFGDSTKQMSVVGITGTNGKSSIASFTAQISALLGGESATIGTLGYGRINQVMTETGMTTPDLVSCHRIFAELLEEGVGHVAMEVSSHGIDQNRIDQLSFRVAVISNITRDHLDYHGSFEAYAAIKKSFLLSGIAQTAVVNIDDPECKKLVQTLRDNNQPVITYSVESDEADIYAKVNAYTQTGLLARISSAWGATDVEIPLVGTFNLGNLLAAIAANCAIGNKFAEVMQVVSRVHSLEGRMQAVEVNNDVDLPRVYIDFAHTPDALAHVLKALKHHTKNNLWVVFGCGGDRDVGKRAVMGEIAAKLADRVVLTSDNPRGEDPNKILADIMGGVAAQKPVEQVLERRHAISMAIGSCANNDLVLVAGKGHEEYQLVGSKKLPFSDYVVAKNALEQRRDAWQVSK
ncbi:MAG: UDP-N-acetylmuramoyl-L-alanyl-D-glutamate--2,6-diaminopimelate ligase [Agarilytica sp.]